MATLPDSISNCLELRLSPQERIEWFSNALGVAFDLEIIGLENRYEALIANAHVHLGDNLRAAEICQKSFLKARDKKDRHGMAIALSSLAVAYRHLGQLYQSATCCIQAIELSQSIPDQRAEGRALGNLGLTYSNMGKNRDAIELYVKRLAIAQQTTDCRGKAMSLGIWVWPMLNWGKPMPPLVSLNVN